MKHLALLLVLICFSFSSFADKGDRAKPLTSVAAGCVTGENGETIAGAMLTIVETGECHFSDMEGNYHFTYPAGKVCTIMISTIGYQPLTLKSNELIMFSEQVLEPLR